MGLELFMACDHRDPSTARLIVARTFAQADAMTPPGWTVKIASRFEAYRLGRVGVLLEYATPAKRATVEETE